MDSLKRTCARIIGRKILWFDEVSSTNDIALALALEGEEEGVIVVADHQTHGRGRFRRQWISPKGAGLWMSVILRPEDISPAMITIFAGLSVAEAVRNLYNVPIGIKWPNDLQVRGRKVGGILTEMQGKGMVILGIGVNTALQVHELPSYLRNLVTSLDLESNCFVDREELLEEVLNCLNKNYSRLCEGEVDEIIARWKVFSTIFGSPVRLVRAGAEIVGVPVDVDVDGGLLLRTDMGIIEKFYDGEVQVLHDPCN